MTFAIDSVKRSVLMSSTKGSFSVHEVSGLMTGKKECAPFQINKTVNAKPENTSLKRASKRKDWASLPVLFVDVAKPRIHPKNHFGVSAVLITISWSIFFSPVTQKDHSFWKFQGIYFISLLINHVEQPLVACSYLYGD